jgi:hypothetical protein
MIVQPRDGQLFLIRQPDHAAASGLFAEHWGNAAFARPEPFGPVCVAARHHDDGWLHWEAAPRIDPRTRRPYQFYALPVAEHAAFYRRGIDSVLARDRYAGLLVLLHLAGLYALRLADKGGFGPPPTDDERQALQTIRDDLHRSIDRLRGELAAAGTDLSRLHDNYKLLQVFDRLSLYLCVSRPRADTLGPYPPDFDPADLRFALTPADDETVLVSPYPFDVDPLPVAIRAGVVPDRDYESDDDFRAAFAAAPTAELSFRLCAGVK